GRGDKARGWPESQSAVSGDRRHVQRRKVVSPDRRGARRGQGDGRTLLEAGERARCDSAAPPDGRRRYDCGGTRTAPRRARGPVAAARRSEEHTSELQSREKLV